MDHFCVGGAWRGMGIRLHPVFDLAGAVDADRPQLLSSYPNVDQCADGRFADGIQVADGLEADDALRPQGAIEQISQDLRLRGGPGSTGPDKMAVHQFVTLY